MGDLPYDVSDALDNLLSAHDRKIRAEIDACACQTERDWRKLREAEVKYEDERTAFETLLRKKLAARKEAVGR